MTNPKTNKRVPNSNSSLLGFDEKQKKRVDSRGFKPYYIYAQEEIESTAIDSIFDYLFGRCEDINRGKLVEHKL